MSENITKRKNSKYYYYDFMLDGVRYKGTTKNVGKKFHGYGKIDSQICDLRLEKE